MRFSTRQLLAAVTFGVCATTAMATEMRYAHVGAEGDFQTVFAAQAAADIAEATQGEVTVQVFPASQLGNVAEMVDGVRMGAIHMGHDDFASWRALCPARGISSRTPISTLAFGNAGQAVPRGAAGSLGVDDHRPWCDPDLG